MTGPPNDPDELDHWLERAAIREYDGEQPRAEAERGAWVDVMRARARGEQLELTSRIKLTTHR